MKLDALVAELVDIHEPGATQVLYFDGAQSWDIELMVASHRTGTSILIQRKPRTVEQELLEACKTARAFLKGLEVNTDPGDPLSEIRRRVHGPLLEKLEFAISAFNRENERR